MVIVPKLIVPGAAGSALAFSAWNAPFVVLPFAVTLTGVPTRSVTLITASKDPSFGASPSPKTDATISEMMFSRISPPGR